jgi:fengycin family lipopeptide synthetase B
MQPPPLVCIAGASRGIGRAVAEAFARQGARLLLLARSEPAPAMNAESLSIQCDVSHFGSVRDAIDSAVARWGRIDVLVNCAAILGPTGELWTTGPSSWSDAIQANLVGTYNTMRAALPHMIRARSGKIVNFAGGGAAYGYPLFSAYGASKAAVVRLTETAAIECAPHGIQINVVAPGAIETAMLKQVREAGGEVKTVGTMQQAVDVVLYLASPAADHISGRFIHARDNYRDFPAPLSADAYTLRRIQP